MRVAERVPAWRVYLALGRVSNLPTVWTNCVAGAALATGALTWRVVPLAAAITVFYTGGMYLNDAFDAAFDRVHRRERPIPRGLADARTVGLLGTAMLMGAVAMVFMLSARAGAFGLALAALIVYYSWRHKRDRLSPLVMALCRGCVYLIAAAVVSGDPGRPVLAGAAILTIYVIVLSQLAKYGHVPGSAVAVLIAGISLVDAAMVMAATRDPMLALATASGFAFTLALQRFTPGT